MLFYLSETLLFPTPADPPDPPDPGKMVPELALRPSLPHAPGVRMTVVQNKLPQNIVAASAVDREFKYILKPRNLQFSGFRQFCGKKTILKRFLDDPFCRKGSQRPDATFQKRISRHLLRGLFFFLTLGVSE